MIQNVKSVCMWLVVVKTFALIFTAVVIFLFADVCAAVCCRVFSKVKSRSAHMKSHKVAEPDKKVHPAPAALLSATIPSPMSDVWNAPSRVPGNALQHKNTALELSLRLIKDPLAVAMVQHGGDGIAETSLFCSLNLKEKKHGCAYVINLCFSTEVSCTWISLKNPKEVWQSKNNKTNATACLEGSALGCHRQFGIIQIMIRSMEFWPYTLYPSPLQMQSQAVNCQFYAPCRC